MSSSHEFHDQVAALLDSRLELLRIQGSQVILSVKERMPTPERGKLLLDTEKQLRREMKRQLEVLLEPKGDLSKLRERLRGVTLDGERDTVFTKRYRTDKSPKNGGSGQSESN